MKRREVESLFSRLSAKQKEALLWRIIEEHCFGESVDGVTDLINDALIAVGLRLSIDS